MPVIVRFRAIALGLAITVTGCASPPNADVDAAKAAVDRAATDRAGQYAAGSLKAAQDAQAALDAELKAQEGKWLKSTTRPRNSQSLRRRQATRRPPMLLRVRRRPMPSRPKRKPMPRPGQGQHGAAPHRGADQGANQDQGRQAGIPRHCAVGACRRRGHD